MSSRALRKLQQLKDETNVDEDEEEVQPIKSSKKKNKAHKSGNIFDLVCTLFLLYVKDAELYNDICSFYSFLS